jgi:hypothetical protein
MGLQAAAMKTEKQCCTNPGAWWMFLPWTLTVSDPLLLGSVQTLTQSLSRLLSKFQARLKDGQEHL